MVGLKFMFICCSLIFATPVEYGDSPVKNLDIYYQSGLDFYQSRAYQNAKSTFEKVIFSSNLIFVLFFTNLF